MGDLASVFDFFFTDICRFPKAEVREESEESGKTERMAGNLVLMLS